MNLSGAKNRSSVYAVQLRKAVGNKIAPHILCLFQWASLVLSLAFNLNISVAVTGALADGGLKVILHFHIWMLLFPAVLGARQRLGDTLAAAAIVQGMQQRHQNSRA